MLNTGRVISFFDSNSLLNFGCLFFEFLPICSSYSWLEGWSEASYFITEEH